MIPVEITDDGDVSGVWPEVRTVSEGGVQVQLARTEDFKDSGVTYSQEWFQYCGVESYAGLDPAYEGDNLFHVSGNPAYDWQSETYEEGDPLNVDDFGDYETWNNGFGTPRGKPATATWRSQDTESIMPVQVIRSPVVERLANGEGDVGDATRNWLRATTDRGVIAWLNGCTHFCRVSGWKRTADAATFGDANEVYFQRHQSLYDPFSVVQTLFTARPRPQ